jgi:hypothetical protein
MRRRRPAAVQSRNLAHQVAEMDEDECARFLYVSHIGRVFTTIANFEHALVWALLGTNQIRVGNEVNQSTPAHRHVTKHEILKSYTLGNLIKILENHRADDRDIAYLRFVQRNRDYFIHRFFGDALWPGEADARFVEPIIRRLLYLEIIFGRATDRIWKIIARNGYAELIDLGDAGQLIVHPWDN